MAITFIALVEAHLGKNSLKLKLCRNHLIKVWMLGFDSVADDISNDAVLKVLPVGWREKQLEIT